MYCEICSDMLAVISYEINTRQKKVLLRAHCDKCDHSQCEELLLENHFISFTIIQSTQGKRKVRVEV